eukprot:1146838-Pelagomonas_calceolata.AAC.4
MVERLQVSEVAHLCACEPVNFPQRANIKKRSDTGKRWEIGACMVEGIPGLDGVKYQPCRKLQRDL